MGALADQMAILIGLLTRLALPLALTAVLAALLRRLDAHWQSRARPLQIPALARPQRPCWDVRHCPPERRARCAAFLQPNTPCWQLFRDDQGELRADCLGCDVFKQAPARVSAFSPPNLAGSHVEALG